MKKRILMALLVLMASISMVMARSMKVYQNGQLKTIYYISKSESVVFSEDFPFPPGDDPIDPNAPKVAYTHAVDLGLPSGLKWADMNVGADKPEDYGWDLAWGETEDKSTYDWSTYKWCSNGSWTGMTKYTIPDDQTSGIWYSGSTFVGDNKMTLDPDDDAAHVNWGGNWRMPTDAEMTELCTKCTWTWTTQNGVNGRKVTGPNGNSIFLPAAASRELNSLLGLAGSCGQYWSSSLEHLRSNSLDVIYSYYAHGVQFGSSYVHEILLDRYCGFSVRPVCSE